MHMSACTHTYTHTNIHTQIHTHIHTQTHAHTHMQTYRYLQKINYKKSGMHQTKAAMPV